MFAILSIAGFQEMVKVGDVLDVPLLDSAIGKEVTWNEVLLTAKDDIVHIGKPFVQGASVTAKLVSEGRGDKVRVVKFRRHKRYHRTKGHRQDFATIEIVAIQEGK